MSDGMSLLGAARRKSKPIWLLDKPTVKKSDNDATTSTDTFQTSHKPRERWSLVWKGSESSKIGEFVPHPPIEASSLHDCTCSDKTCRVFLPDETILDEKRREVVSGSYEGGARVWECSIDVIRLLLGLEHSDNPLLNRLHTILSQLRTGSDPIRLLEIGCGVALPTLHILKEKEKGECSVVLQDLNGDVLDGAMQQVANAVLGVDCESTKTLSITAVEGAWSDEMCNLPCFRQGFDLILTSETIYRLDTIPQLVALILASLKPDGIAVVGTKRFYFGVGGGARAFEAEVRKQNPELSTHVAATFVDGRSNVREVIVLGNAKRP